MYSKELIKRIKVVVDMRMLLRELGVRAKKDGVYYCPFHEDNNPSFTATKDIATDWHENKTYDVISITQKIKGCKFNEAVEYCAKFAGISIKSFDDNQEGYTSPIEKILKYGKYHFNKNKESILKRFEIIKKYKIPEQLHNELYYFPEDSSHPQRGRLCLIWYDKDNNPIGFVGRALNLNEKPKYKYSGILANEKFSKNCFYNINKAKNNEKVIIVEGVWDAFIASHFNQSAVVATGGIVSPKLHFFSDFLNTYTALEPHHQHKNTNKIGQFEHLKAVIFAPDPDVNGISGFISSVQELYEDLKERNVECFAFNLEKDLDEALINNELKIQDIHEKALPLTNYLELTKEIIDNTEGTKKINETVLTKKLEDKIEILSDEILRMISNKKIPEIEILKKINELQYESEKEKYISKLVLMRGIPRKAILKDLKAINEEIKNRETNNIDFLNKILSDKTKAIHPTYYTDENIALLGFSVDIQEDEELKTVDFRIINDTKNKRFQIIQNNTFTIDDTTYIIDIKNRVPPRLLEYWNKSELEKIISENNIKSLTLQNIYNNLQQLIKKYVDLRDETAYKILSIYVMMTYFHNCFSSIPFLFVFGPKGSGKSHLITILQLLSFNAVKIKGITMGALGDTVDSTKSTLIIDQAETLSLPQNLEMIGILADSYSISGGKRRLLNIQNGTRKIIELETYSPKIFASTRELDEDLRDRCILIQMLKSTKQFPKPNPNADVWKKFRSELYKCYLRYASTFYKMYYKNATSASDRIEEITNPISFLLDQLQIDKVEKAQLMTYIKKNIRLTQFEINEDEKALFDALLDEFGTYDTSIKITEKKLKEILNTKGLIRDNVSRWAVSKLKQFNLIKEIVKENQNGKGIKYYIIEKDDINEIYNRYFFNNNNSTSNTDNDFISEDELERAETNNVYSTKIDVEKKEVEKIDYSDIISAETDNEKNSSTENVKITLDNFDEVIEKAYMELKEAYETKKKSSVTMMKM